VGHRWVGPAQPSELGVGGPELGLDPLPASSGTISRHRLNRGGNRQLNRALFTIAMVQARWDPQGSAYLLRNAPRGKPHPRPDAA
jgi:transposase